MPNPADPTECLMQIKTIELVGGRAYKIATHEASQYIQHAALTQYVNPRPEIELISRYKYVPGGRGSWYVYASKTRGGTVCTDESIFIVMEEDDMLVGDISNHHITVVFLSKSKFYLYEKFYDYEGDWFESVKQTYQGVEYYCYFMTYNTDYNGEITEPRETWYKKTKADSYFDSSYQVCDEVAYICFNGTIS